MEKKKDLNIGYLDIQTPSLTKGGFTKYFCSTKTKELQVNYCTYYSKQILNSGVCGEYEAAYDEDYYRVNA